ncbi:hypothetical protein ACFLWB_00225 [Chloroflexota bacterium]
MYTYYEKHSKVALLYHLATSKLYRPSHFKVIFSDLAHGGEPIHENLVHCEGALKWLFEAQDVTGTGGVSAEYSFSWGWAWPCPETTGYIIPTLLDYPKHFNTSTSEACTSRAIKMADWLTEIQQPNGAYYFSLHPIGNGSAADRISSAFRKPGAFDTGQVIAGLARAFEETGNEHYLKAAIKAGNWLVDNLSPNGTWVDSLHNRPHVFDTFLAWRLIYLSQISGIERYETAARKNLDWAIDNQRENGWSQGYSHFPNTNPLTHGICYAAHGFLEAGLQLNESRFLDAALRPAEALLKIYSAQGFLPAHLDNNWKSNDKFSCLVGDAQASVLWFRLYLLTKDSKYVNAALEMNRRLKLLQCLTSPENGIRGGIKGSHPIWGNYLSFRYPSWAVKFFIDALLLEESIK